MVVLEDNLYEGVPGLFRDCSGTMFECFICCIIHGGPLLTEGVHKSQIKWKQGIYCG